MRIAVISETKTAYEHDDCSISYLPSGTVVTPKEWQLYDAAFLLAPYSEQDVIYWTGHPHLRCVKTTDELTAELDCVFSHIECEKKLLIAFPNFALLQKYHPYCSELEQVYLLCREGSHRIRKRVADGVVTYVETFKSRISGTVAHEEENRISEEKYLELLQLADPSKHAIRKKRYCFIYKRQYFELDVYDFWQDKATLELELRSEFQHYKLPPEIQVIRDVSDDYRYKNNYLASIRYEDYSTELL